MAHALIAAREEFGIYLEGSGPGPHAERSRRKAGEAAFTEAARRWAGRLHGPSVTPSVVENALGKADRVTDGTLSYALPQRPGYVYSFRFDPASDGLRSAGFDRVGRTPTLSRPPTESAMLLFVAELAAAGITASELEGLLGPPAEIIGWWPIETWEYPGGLVLDLRHGVVE